MGKSLTSSFASKRHFLQSGMIRQELLLLFGQEIIHPALKTPFEETQSPILPNNKVSVSFKITGNDGQVLVSPGTFWIDLEKAVERTVMAKSSG